MDYTKESFSSVVWKKCEKLILSSTENRELRAELLDKWGQLPICFSCARHLFPELGSFLFA